MKDYRTVLEEKDLYWGMDFLPNLLFAVKGKLDYEDKLHKHDDFTEMSFILSGHGKYVVNGITYPVEQGDIIVCNAGEYHRNIIVDNDYTTEFIVGFSDYAFPTMPKNTIILPLGRSILKLKPSTKRELNKICYDMISESESDNVGKFAMMRCYLMNFLMTILREMVVMPEKETTSLQFESYRKSYVVNQIISFLHNNYDKKISLDQIAHNMYLSPVYISKLFKEETGESPINHLIKIRIGKACELLENMDSGNVRMIAEAVGYEDVYHFSKLFKKYMGVSPQTYRRNSFLEKNQ
ncbi:MAG: AraC family transcriptional regulator [Lachnospiraceae bacterium]|nr:AraC family transcriptional regulator [Lachnospiraceae bacterium]